MHHVNVASASDISQKQKPAAITINRMTSLSLISLIEAYRTKDFDHTTLKRAIQGFRQFTKEIAKIAESTLFVDSGGYSIITGEVAPKRIMRCIESYCHCLANSQDAFDYIFSLDVPFNAKYPSFNKRPTIEKHNRTSLQKSVEILEKHPGLKEKFLLIYHFKTVAHYEIWQDLYKELDLGKYIKHRAIGGMVSLKQKAGIDFAPFIATAYQCLVDYKKTDVYKNREEFRLHLLGINVKYDRFVIAFMEQLFQEYLGPTIDVNFTYDTINYRISGIHIKEIYDLVNGKLLTYKLDEIPENLLSKIYIEEQLVEEVKQEIKLKKETKRFSKSSIITPLKVYSELSIDSFFEEQIRKHRLIKKTISSTQIIDFKAKIKRPIEDIFFNYDEIFGLNTSKSAKRSLSLLQEFHYWYMNHQDDEHQLDKLSRKFIKRIGLHKMLHDPKPKNVK